MKVRKKKPPTYLTSKSVRHDVLYSKARYVLNQRHIKRPWFNLNPFLEKTDESIDLENYLPEESKYIQPLESLVLCESFRSEHPVETRQLSVDTFFKYLYSGKWSGGCSVRVLEGQLLDQLLVCLYRMETKGSVVRHTTHAFARNKRPRTGCYKLADKTAYGFIEDTLLIEFAYFARLTKSTANPKTQNSLEYLRHGLPEFSDDPTTPESSPTLEDIPRRKRTSSISFDMRSMNSQPPEVNFDLYRNEKEKSKQRRFSLISKPINAVRFIQAATPKPRRMSVIDSATSSGTPISVLQGYSNEKATPSTSEKRSSKPKFTDYKFEGIDPKQLLKKFPVHRYVKPNSFKENKEEKLAEGEKSDDEEGFYGDEFYLSDGRVSLNQQPEGVAEKLQRKKLELQQRRRERREAMAERKRTPDHPVLPPLPPLELEARSGQDKVHYTINMPEEVPTFEQFVKILKDDEYYDPRYRNKVRQKSKRIAKRYYMAKGQRRNSSMFSADSLPGSLLDTTRRLSLLVPPRTRERERRNSNVSDSGSKGTIRLPTLQESSRTLPKMPKLPDIKKNGYNNGPRNTDPSEIAEEVHGVTDSVPCRDHCLAVSGSFNKSYDDKTLSRHDDKTLSRHDDKTLSRYDDKILSRHDDKTLSRHEDKTLSRQQDTVLGLPSTNTHRPGTDRGKAEFLQSSSEASDRRLSSSPVPPIFPKAAVCDEEYESPEYDSESDSDDEPSMFDAGKLNIKYSIERLRRRQKKKKKKPVFYDILAKYYKMQDALQAFRKGSMTREVKNAKARAKRLSLAGFLRGDKLEPMLQPYEPIQEFVLGKMKKFEFLETKPKRPLNLDTLAMADFSVPCLRNFFIRLVEALDDFVVRREIVVSDLPTYYKSATSVTFTKKSCFANKHENC